ncbi:VanW family protein [Demequina capsici]|uniref:VanW family protein n=1 Tax=Demequina capsici TaxID=3075620 RepID=A0AA96JAV4_9MICO|nr:VanW family protein [Demequina sp. OYTSA14]WNM25111.1 VanW family protein [Demequina sp. OYTSA14]
MSRRRRLQNEQQRRAVEARRRSVAGRRLRASAAQHPGARPDDDAVTVDAAAGSLPDDDAVTVDAAVTAPRMVSPYLQPASAAAVASTAEPEAEAEPEVEQQPDAAAEFEPEPDHAAEPESEREPEAAAEFDPEPEPEPASAPEVEPEVEPAPQSEPEPEPAPDAAPEFVPEPAAEPERESLYAELAAPDEEPLPEFLTREPEPPRPPRRWPRVVGLAIVVLALLYVIAQAAVADRIPRGAEALGVQIGGMSADEATTALTPAADSANAAPVSLTVGNASYVTFPTRLGVSVDVTATVSAYTGFTLSPARLWEHVAGVGELSPALAVDDQSMGTASTAAASVLASDARDAQVTIVDGVAQAIAGTQQVTVAAGDVRDAVLGQWPASSVTVPATFADPELGIDDATAYATALNSGPLATDVSLTWDGGEATVPAQEVADNASVDVVDGAYQLEVDGRSIAPALIKEHPELEIDPVDASVSFDSSHQIVIDEGAPGLTVDGGALGDVIVSAVSGGGGAGEMPFVATQAQRNADSLHVADLAQIVSSFDTPLTNEPVRTQNLVVAAAHVADTIIEPGEQFNLHDVLSPITAEEGYQDAHVIVNGILTEGIGGGLSQMATTSYNAAYLAGYQIDAHRPHSVWFTRYPAGRESTIYGTQINMVFTNDTPYALVMNSYVEGGRLHVDIWSTPYYTVQTQASDKTNVVQPGVKKLTSSSCSPKSAGQAGFTITNYRQVFLNGDQVKDESYTWTYAPDDAIECTSSSASTNAGTAD